MNKILFQPLCFSDISILHAWFNMPHVQQFYSLRSWTEGEVLNKITPYINHEKPVFGFIIWLNDTPVGYVQYYRLLDFPWPEQDFSDEIIAQAAGIDFFIGDASLIGKGMGACMLQQILKDLIWPHFSYCVMDPNVENQAMLRCAAKVGFEEHKIIQTEDALQQKVSLKLMLLKNKLEM